jgi:O-antigen ligase
MLDSPWLITYPFPLRLAVLLVLVYFTVKYTKQGIQNGILIGLVTGMSSNPIVLFRGSELIIPGLPNQISLDRIVWPLVVAVFFLKRSRGQTERLPPDWIERGLLLFIAVMLASMMWHGSYTDLDGDWALTKIIRGYAFPFVAYFMVRRAARTAKDLHAFVVGLACVAAYFVLTGIAETFAIRALVIPQFILNSELGVHPGRARGIFLNASLYGLAVATALPLLVWLYFSDRAPRRYLWPIIALLSAIPLINTLQRAAWLSVIVSVGATVLAWPKRRMFLTGALVFAALCGFWLGSEELMQRVEAKLQRQSTIDYRLMHIERGLAMFRDNPMFGVGMNRYGAEVQAYSQSRTELTAHAHNTWITLLAELGLIGLFAYTLPFGFVLSKSIMLYWRLPQYRAFLGILAGVTLAFIVMSISIELRSNLYSNALLFALWGMTLGRIQKPSHAKRRQAVEYRRALGTAMIPSEASKWKGRFSDRPRPQHCWP